MEGGGTSQLPAAQLRAIFRGPGHRTGNLEVDGEGGDSKPPRPSFVWLRAERLRPTPFPSHSWLYPVSQRATSAATARVDTPACTSTPHRAATSSHSLGPGKGCKIWNIIILKKIFLRF